MILGIYASPEGDIVIGDESSDADLDKAALYAKQHMRAGQQIGFQMMGAIADARAMKAKPVMFKSLRAA